MWSDCGRIFGLKGWRCSDLRAMMEPAREEPIARARLFVATTVIGFASRRFRPVRHLVLLSRQSKVGVNSFGLLYRFKATVFNPYSPDNTSEFVSQSDGSFVVASGAFDLKGP